MDGMDRYVEVEPGVRLRAEDAGSPDAPALLLVMGANASGLAWPDGLVAALAAHHRVIRYDHRDTGRSSWAFDSHPYAIADLAGDAVAILDALGIERAHVVGLSLGGMLTQLLLLDHPDRLYSAVLTNTGVLPGGDDDTLPPSDPRLLAMWEHLYEPRDREAELAWRVEHWRLLNGDVLPFDPAEWRRQEERIIAHAGRHDIATNLPRADPAGLDRGGELGAVTTPVLVVEAPEDPAFPPPHSAQLAAVIPGARLVTIPGMGHALPSAVLPAYAEAILGHTGANRF
jgi:pimeloyl-ACP methyl ester carboxylesterase